MKKFFSLLTLVACFSFLAVTAEAQLIRNTVDCGFKVEVTYAKIGDCAPEGSIFVNVDAFATENITNLIPPGYEMIQARGGSDTLCGFGVGGDCSAFNATYTADCDPGNVSTACDYYMVDYTPSVVTIHH